MLYLTRRYTRGAKAGVAQLSQRLQSEPGVWGQGVQPHEYAPPQGAFYMYVDLSAHGFFAIDTKRCGFDWNIAPGTNPDGTHNQRTRGHPFNYFTQGVGCVEVEIDVLTGDWLAELTMLILARTRLKRPGGGYARTFVTQMEHVMGTCLDRGIKVVSNAGGLDPDGCAEAVAEVGAGVQVVKWRRGGWC